jgi:hypothetical protein
LALVAFVCLGLAGWAVYDGAIGYPNQRERALKYLELFEQDRMEDWDAICEQRGWSIDPPGEPKTEYDVMTQYTMAALVAPVGLLFLFFLARAWPRWIEADDTGLATSWGERVEYDQIVALDKKQWKAKGIAKVEYQADGRNRRLVLDDCKYDFALTEKILREVESHIDPEQITGGPPQPPPKEEAEAELDNESEGKTDADSVTAPDGS